MIHQIIFIQILVILIILVTVDSIDENVPIIEKNNSHNLNATRIRKNFIPFYNEKNIARPSSANTAIVSLAILRFMPLHVGIVLTVPYAVKSKTWRPTCPLTMQINCPSPFSNSSSSSYTMQPIKISDFPPQKVSLAAKDQPRTYSYLRGGFHYTEKPTQNLRGLAV